MESIPLTDVLDRMNEALHNGMPKPFSIICIKHDRQVADKSGEPRYYTNATVITKIGKHNTDKPKAIAQDPMTTTKDAKAQNHWDNFTRNIRISNGQVRKIHVRLITHFNGQKVHW